MALQPLWALAAFQFPDLFTIGITPWMNDQLIAVKELGRGNKETNGGLSPGSQLEAANRLQNNLNEVY
jgi:hypothetical protein